MPSLDALLDADPMMAAIRGTPDYFEIGDTAAVDVAGALAHGIDRVVVAGMGGSAFPADILALHPSIAAISLTVSRDYRIRVGGPDSKLGARTLVIASSFSGNTEETLAAFVDAGRRGAQRLVLTGGGRLAEMATAANVPVIRLSRPFSDFQPRAATAMFVGALARVLHDIGLTRDLKPDLERVAAHLLTLDVRTSAADLAETLAGRIPVLLATPPYGALARVIKIKFNENAKMPAFWDELAEFDHNALCGFTRGHAPLSVVLLRDSGAPDRMARRADMTAVTLREAGIPTHDIVLSGQSRLERAFGALYLFDVLTCRLAIRDGIDPNPVELIETFKARLGPFRLPTG